TISEASCSPRIFKSDFPGCYGYTNQSSLIIRVSVGRQYFAGRRWQFFCPGDARDTKILAKFAGDGYVR
ncbi:MAG: hypothetical protein EAS52_12700, partial [Parapedobacter sp.]